MALKALTTGDTVKYVCDSDSAKTYVDELVNPAKPEMGYKKTPLIDDAAATVFTLRPLDPFQLAHIVDNAASTVGRQGSEDLQIVTRLNQASIETVRFGLAGFANLPDARGNLAHFKPAKAIINGREYQVAHDDTIRLLDLDVIRELADQIKKISEVSKEEEKNSASA